MQDNNDETDLHYNNAAEDDSDRPSNRKALAGLAFAGVTALLLLALGPAFLTGGSSGAYWLIALAVVFSIICVIALRRWDPGTNDFEQDKLTREWVAQRAADDKGEAPASMMESARRETAERIKDPSTHPAGEEQDGAEPSADGDEEKHVGLLETVSAEREILEEMPEFNDGLVPRMYNGVMRPHIFPTLGWRIMGVAVGLLLWVGYLVGDYYQTPLLPLYTAIVLLLLGAASVVPLAVSLTNLHRRHKAYRKEHPKAWILVPLFIVGGLALIGVILAMIHVDFHPLLVIVTWTWSIFWAMVQWSVQSLPHFIFALVLIMIPPMVAKFAVWLANPIYMAHGELAKVTGFFRRTRGSMDLSDVTDVKDHQGQIPWFKRAKVPWGDVELENPGQDQAFSYLSDLPIKHITHIREGVLWAKLNRPRR